MKQWILAAACVAVGFSVKAQSYEERVQAYVSQYKGLAMDEQRRSGIPAAITLAQGIHETEAGNSELATKAHNHFGLKCKKDWTGDTYAHTDDAQDECFRKYSSDTASYRDHSDYMHSRRWYDPCFAQSVTDYAAWATQLKKCGYATNPQYPQKLITLIETFHLQEFTYAAMDKSPVKADEGVATIKTSSETATNINRNALDPAVKKPAEVVPVNDLPPVAVAQPTHDAPAQQFEIADDPIAYDRPRYKNSLKGFYAHKGDALLEPAIRYDVRYAKLLEINDLPDEPAPADMFIYLESKHSKGKHAERVLADGETLTEIAWQEGITMKQLRAFNRLEDGETPLTGTVLELQRTVDAKPLVKQAAVTEKPAAKPEARPVAAQDAAPTGIPVSLGKAETDASPTGDAQEAAQYSPPATAKAVTPEANMPAKADTATRPPASAGINIANEEAVEETTPEPQDDFAKLKAKLDKSVYSDNKKQDAPKPVVAAAPKETPKPAARPAAAAATPRPDPKPAAATASAGPEAYHTVAKGETAYSIARQYNLSMKALMAMNNLNFEAIKVGQKLRVK